MLSELCEHLAHASRECDGDRMTACKRGGVPVELGEREKLAQDVIPWAVAD